MSDPQELCVSSDLVNLAHIAAFVSDMAARAGFDETQIYDIQMAVDEACTNTIEHAYGGRPDGEVRVCCHIASDDLVVSIYDHGTPFDPSAVPAPDLSAPLEERAIGGLGIFFMQQLMDEVRFSSDPVEGNCVTMSKSRQGAVTNPTAPYQEEPSIVRPVGRVDASATPHLEEELRALLDAGKTALVVDLAETTYLSSSGLRALLIAHRRANELGGALSIRHTPPRVMHIIRLAGFDRILSLDETPEQDTAHD